MNKSILLLITLVIATTIGCNPKELPIIKDKVKEWDDIRTEQTKDSIKNSPELQELDIVCKQIPIPDGFKFIAMHLSPSKSPLLTYYYLSEEDFNKSDAYFREHFTKNGWENIKNNSLNKVSEFRNENYRVTIQYGGIGGDANYGIGCKKLSVD